MFEVFAFRDEDLPEQLREKVLHQGGWRDQDRQWYELVEASKAERFEVRRRGTSSDPARSWEGWVRLGGRYTPARPCAECSGLFRQPDETKTICQNCTNQKWRKIDEAINSLRSEIEQSERLPKGCWQKVKEIREAIEKAEGEQFFSRVRILKLKQHLHPVYRLLIERRRQEQEEYRKRVKELEAAAKQVVERSFAGETPDRGVVEELKKLRMRLRSLVDQRKLGIKEFRRLIAELRKASENEERKFTAYRQALEEKRRRWEQNEKELTEKLKSIEIGIEPNPENWNRLLELRNEIKERAQRGDLGPQARRRLNDLCNQLLDQERTLREAAKQEAAVKRKVKKETSRKRAGSFKTRVNNISIGLAFSQATWNELVSLQREVIRLKNEGGLLLEDFKDVMGQINEKLDTLKKLRGLTSGA